MVAITVTFTKVLLLPELPSVADASKGMPIVPLLPTMGGSNLAPEAEVKVTVGRTSTSKVHGACNGKSQMFMDLYQVSCHRTCPPVCCSVVCLWRWHSTDGLASV